MRRRLGDLVRAAVLGATLATLAGCGESPREVYGAAREAVEAKEFEAFAATLSDRSARLLRGLQEAADESRGRYTYLKDLYDLLPIGDVQAEEERGNLTILKVGKSERDSEEVILLRERDGWRIDVLDSPRLWEPLMVRRR